MSQAPSWLWQPITADDRSRKHRSEFHDLHYAVIEFFAGGRLYSVKSPESRFPRVYYIGQKLQILYQPDDPEDYEILQRGIWYQGSRICNAASLLLIVAGLLCFFFAARG